MSHFKSVDHSKHRNLIRLYFRIASLEKSAERTLEKYSDEDLEWPTLSKLLSDLQEARKTLDYYTEKQKSPPGSGL